MFSVCNGGHIENSKQNEDIITVEKVSVGYGEKSILEKVSFSVRKGEAFSILGPSGCGKSTLFKAIIGLLAIQEGRIRIAGEDIGNNAEASTEKARSQIGVLFQSAALVGSLTVGENVALPIEHSTDLPREVIESLTTMKLEMVQLGDYVHAMPADLSGGMRKRAALARALVLDPRVLLCDEPASGLDPPTASEIDNLLLELKNMLGMTLVIVTHELASIENVSDRCIMLSCDKKGILDSGSPFYLKNESREPAVREFFKRRFEKHPIREDGR